MEDLKNNKMNILITGGNFKNKGAELMLVSLISKVNEKIPNAKVFVTPFLGNKKTLNSMGVGYVDFPLFHYGHKRFSLSLKQPSFVRLAMKLKGIASKGDVRLSDIDVVFDISGFAFGAKWGGKPLNDLVNFVKKMKGLDAKFFMMPQAFGPFNVGNMSQDMRELCKNLDLLIARDKTSFNYVTEVAESNSNILLHPDITLTYKSKHAQHIDISSENYCLVVPNERMLDKASISWRANYISVMAKMISQVLNESDLDVIVLIHAQGDSNDAKVGRDIVAAVENDSKRLKIMVEEDPTVLKGIISQSRLLIGSRFHALASALSSNVPAIATSWLHKYEMLFEDYNCRELSFVDPDEKIFIVLNNLMKDSERDLVVARLKVVNDQVATKSEKMWQEVLAKVEG